MVSHSTLQAVDMAALRQRRDGKVSVVVRTARPAWIVDVKEIPESSTILFDLVYRPRPNDGWYRRRYEYDGESDVLYHRGEQVVSEAEVRALPDEAAFKG